MRVALGAKLRLARHGSSHFPRSGSTRGRAKDNEYVDTKGEGENKSKSEALASKEQN